MWNKVRNSRGFYALLAFLIAVICWLYVDLAQKEDANMAIKDIPVTFTDTKGLSDLDLLILDEDLTIDIVVSGPRSVITKLNRNNVIITASAADITEAGVYSLKCNFILPSSITSSSSRTVRVTSQSATAVDVNVVDMVTKTIPIRAEFTGTVAANRFYDEDSFVLQQRELEIRGEESVVNAVSYAKVVLNETNLTDTWTGWLDVILCDQEGQVLQLDNLETEVSSISVAFYVECTKEIPLTVTLNSGGGATEEDADYTVTPSTITVSGQEILLDSLEEINLGTVDLSQVITTGEYEFEIELPAGVSSMDGTTSATVEVSVTGLETRRIVTSNIRLINAPDDHSYSFDNLEVRVRGKAEDFSMLMNNDVQVILDLKDVDLVNGATVTVPAQVEIVGISELGVLGTYSVDVTVLPANAPEADSSSTQ